MNYIEAWTERRKVVASDYDRLLAHSERYKRPAPPLHCQHVYHVYAVELASRNDVQKALNLAGIGTGIHYPVPVHLQKAYDDLGYAPGDLPITESLADRFLSLPIYPELRPEQIVEIVSVLDRAQVEVDESELSPRLTA
jgi:dTDP-4-amino-4,6-dideoxygalactose transaminase